MQLKSVGLSLGVLFLSVLVGAGCGGDDSSSADAGTAARRGQLLVSTSDGRGVVRVGSRVGEQSDVLLVDAETQKPIVGALAEAVEEDGDDGYLVRVSKESAGYRPEVVRCRRGQPATVPLGTSTADVRGRAVRVSSRVLPDELIGEYDLAGVNMVAERETRPEILFLPSLDDAALQAGARFAVYRSVLPQVLFAVKQETTRPTGPTVVRGQARVVSTSGARRGGARVKIGQIAAAGERHSGEELPTPSLSSLTASPPGASGQGMLRWNLDDPMGRVIAFEVGIDTTVPQRRLARETREMPFEVRRGDHLACVRPVFAGADVDPVIRCLQFAAPEAPPAPSVRVSLKPLPLGTPVTARRGMPVVVEVSNEGAVDAPGFPVDVVVSRDGRVEGGLGQVRTLWIDGIKAGGRTTRTTEVTPPRDGDLFLVARADALRVLGEANPEDNLDRAPVKVAADGNRAPLVSVAGTAVGAGTAAVVEGEPLRLRASADDHEDGDLSDTITWYSSRDGKIGQGPVLDTRGLSPGLHRLRAEVLDSGRVARQLSLAPVGRELGRELGRTGRGAIAALVAEGGESAEAELQVEVLARILPPGNTPPRLSAGPDLTTTVGGEVVPAATAADADGDQLVISWEVTGSDGAPVALAEPGQLRPRFVPPTAGLYRMMVTVSDGTVSERDELVVQVLSAAANRPPRVTVSMPAEGVARTPVKAKVEASDEDQDGLTLSYALERPQGSAVLLVDAETRTPGFVPDLGGYYKFIVRADDGRGGVTVASAQLVVASGPTPGLDAGAQPDGFVPGADAGVPPDAEVIRDAGPVDVAQPADAIRADVGSAACDPLAKPACPDGKACLVRFPGDVTECAPAGTLPELARCSGEYQCAPGLQCVASVCVAVCDRQRPSCAVDSYCKVPEGNVRYGACWPSAAPPPDAGGADVGPITCEPVFQEGCARTEDACYVRDGYYQCLLPGPGGEGASCTKPNDCVGGTDCHPEPDGSFCRRYCDPQQPACPGASPICSALPRSRYGLCVPESAPPPPADGGTTTGCDPVKQYGCTRVEDACFVLDKGEQTCLLYGSGVPNQSPCSVHSDCKKGSGCFSGPTGRICRAYCDLRNVACFQEAPFCMQLGSGQFGVCMPYSQSDAATAL